MVKIDSTFQEAYLSYLEVLKLDKKSIDKYLMFYHKFINLYPEVNQKNVDLFLANNNSSPARSMIRNLIKAVRRWDFPIEVKECFVSLDIPKRTGKGGFHTPKFIKRSDIDRITYGINLGNESDNERFRLMALTQFYGGLRISELIGITFENLDKDTYDNNKDKQFQTIKISSESAKFGNERMAYIPTDVYIRIGRWIKAEVNKYPNKPFIKTNPIWGIKGNRYKKILSDVTKQVLGESYNSHSLRHGRGTDLIMEEHKGIEFVKKYLGHADIKSTQIYTHLEDKDIKDQLENGTN